MIVKQSQKGGAFMRMTDNVVQYILSLLEAEHGSAEFRRN